MNISGFFSYSHTDAKIESLLFDKISTEIETRVQQQIVNAQFKLWRDLNNLRIGDKWEREIEDAINAAEIFVCVVSPSWITSSMCQKEYEIFLNKERRRGAVIIPSISALILRKVDNQMKYFNERQMNIYSDIKSRQYTHVHVIDLISMSDLDITKLIDKISEDIVGIIDKIRSFPGASKTGINSNNIRFSKTSRNAEFTPKAYNFSQVDIISDYDLVVRGRDNGGSSFHGQFDFVEKLYIETKSGRVEFGVQRAVLSIESGDGSSMHPSSHVRASSPVVRQLRLHENPAALAISIDPPAGRHSLGELALPPGPGTSENRMAELGYMNQISGSELTATLTVNLNTEGIFLKPTSGPDKSNADISKLEAILAIAAEKQAGAKGGAIVRHIEVRDERKDK